MYVRYMCVCVYMYIYAYTPLSKCFRARYGVIYWRMPKSNMRTAKDFFVNSQPHEPSARSVDVHSQIFKC